MLRVGLTGGIASGKSHVLRRLASVPGVATLDLDRVAHAALAPGGSAAAEVVAAFGDGILDGDGAIDRRKLGAIVFADAAARARLNGLVHPRVRAAEEAWAAENGGEGTLLVTDAALLVETGMHLRFDRLVVAWCPAATQVERVMARDGLPEALARARVEAQMSGDLKREFGHHVVDTTGSLRDTDGQVDEVLVRLRDDSAHRPSRESVPRPRALELLSRSPAGGLDAARLLEHVLRCQGIDLGRLARDLGGDGEWYLRGDGRSADGDGFAEGLALWALVHRGDDLDWLASAAGSLARLVLPPGPPRAEAVYRALEAAAALAAPGRTVPDDLVRRWSGADPGRLEPRRAATAVRLDEQILDALLL